MSSAQPDPIAARVPGGPASSDGPSAVAPPDDSPVGNGTTTTAAGDVDDDPWRWTATDQRLLAIVGLTAALGLGISWWRLGGTGELLEIKRLPESASAYRLDVNRATWVEWAQLEGIGETLGRRIVADRETHGPFRSVDDVSRVSGIGPAKLDAVRRWLVVSGEGGIP
jgi:competence protein ComEA